MRRDAAERQEPMNRIFLRLACLALVVATALRCDTGSPVDPDSSGNPPTENPPAETPTASIHGTVMAGGSPLRTWVSLAGPGIWRARWTSELDGTFDFADLPAGAYTASTAALGFMCESETVNLREGEAVTANIACTQQGPGTIVGTVEAAGSPIPGVVVNVTHAFRSVESAITDASGAFTFTVPSGGPYAVIANPPGTTCESASVVMVEEDRTVTVSIVCLPVADFREIAGDFFFSLPREDDFGPTYSQEGDCPPPLPAERARRSIIFDPGSDTISILGLDPNLTIVGDLQTPDDDCAPLPFCQDRRRWFNGTGSAIRADGSSIRSDLTGNFEFSTYDGGYYYFYGSMKREHRNAGGELVCTETYWAVGDDI
jgi:hypothetical protein